MTDTNRDEGMERVVEKIQKLLNLAAKNSNEAEAASAAAKAQELLTAYNLDMSTIEQGNSGSGKREDARLSGGMYLYERELWARIAELNFCVYFTTRTRVSAGPKSQRTKVIHQHRIVGRVVNSRATKAMGEYLQTTIERLCRERFPVNSQFFTREAVAFREGMADMIGSRLRDRRDEINREEDRKKQQAQAAAKRDGTDTAFALTIADVKDAEEKANYDFMNGAGAWDKREARNAKWDAGYAARRAAQAKADAEAEAAYALWATANPEEAAKEEKKAKAKERAREKAAERRGGWGRYRQPTAREERSGSGYYSDGYEKGKTVSLEPQMDGATNSTKRIGR